MKKIKLTQGQFALVDDEDYAELSKHKWHASWEKKTQSFYAMRTESHGTVDGKQKKRTIRMHREVLGLKFGDPRKGDHRQSGQTLDNRRSNLRIATTQQNNWNKRSCAQSGFKGVYQSPFGNYFASISVNGKRKNLGTRSTKKAAHALYAAAALELHGEFARIA